MSEHEELTVPDEWVLETWRGKMIDAFLAPIEELPMKVGVGKIRLVLLALMMFSDADGQRIAHDGFFAYWVPDIDEWQLGQALKVLWNHKDY